LNTLWKNIASTVILVIVAIVLTKVFWPNTKEIDARLNEIKRTKVVVDSLKMENTKLKARIDSLAKAGQTRLQEIENLKDRIQQQQQSLQAALEALHVYKGTDDDLVRELNELIKSPLPVLPD